MFIMVDGIDGSGKSAIVEIWKQHLAQTGDGIFDLKKYWQENQAYPDYRELKSYEFVFSSEPTYIGIGQTIRSELIKNGADYPEEAIAQAYALDRLILYKKIILPALADAKCVIQDRGVSTSLCYQTLSGRLSLNYLTHLPGNAVALSSAPNHLVIVQTDPKIALARAQARTDKQDNAIFEKIDFQTKAAALFSSPEYRQLFAAHGAAVHYLSANEKIDIIKTTAVNLLNKILT